MMVGCPEVSKDVLRELRGTMNEGCFIHALLV